jgi:hypothetical protein
MYSHFIFKNIAFRLSVDREIRHAEEYIPNTVKYTSHKTTHHAQTKHCTQNPQRIKDTLHKMTTLQIQIINVTVN